MRYKNMRTGVVIETKSKIRGGDWQGIPAVDASASSSKSKVTQAKLKNSRGKRTTGKRAAKPE